MSPAAYYCGDTCAPEGLVLVKRNEDLILGSTWLLSNVYFLYVQLNCALNFTLLISKCKNTIISAIRALLLLSNCSRSFNFSHVHSHTCLLSTPPLTWQRQYRIVLFGEQFYQQKDLNFGCQRENYCCQNISLLFYRFGITFSGKSFWMSAAKTHTNTSWLFGIISDPWWRKKCMSGSNHTQAYIFPWCNFVNPKW